MVHGPSGQAASRGTDGGIRRSERQALGLVHDLTPHPFPRILLTKP